MLLFIKTKTFIFLKLNYIKTNTPNVHTPYHQHDEFVR